MDIGKAVLGILDEVLQLGARAAELNANSPLLGAIPELDSMAVVAVLTLVEERFGVTIEDDEIDGAVFASLATLTPFLEAKLAA